MIAFPNCKINLGLQITGKRPDGFHDLETVFFPVPLKDALEIIPSTNDEESILFSSSGLPIPGNPNDNICIQAIGLLKSKFPQITSLQVHLHKSIPMGAGLGGGSADAAFTLILLNKYFHLNLSPDQLSELALELGSDCPFFIKNKSCFAKGRGEILEEIKLNLSAYKILLINPGIHINTTWAFSQISPAVPIKSIKEIISQPIESWKAELVNVFENPIFQKHVELKELKEKLYNAGAVYASMSGSGSSIYGLFNKDEIPDISHIPTHYFMKELNCQF